MDKQVWTETASLSANSTGYVDLPLSQATTYYYRLKARNAAGDSGYSNTARATTTGGCVVSNGAASITNRYYSNEHDICQAPDRVSAASNVTVGTDAWAEYVAPRIELAPRFHVLDGGRLTLRQP